MYNCTEGIYRNLEVQQSQTQMEFSIFLRHSRRAGRRILCTPEAFGNTVFQGCVNVLSVVIWPALDGWLGLGGESTHQNPPNQPCVEGSGEP